MAINTTDKHMIKAIALGTDPASLQLLKDSCTKTGYTTLVKYFTKSAEATAYCNNFPVDLIFADAGSIEATGKLLREQIPAAIMIIYTSATKSFAVEAFNQRAIDFLLLPFCFERFVQAAEKAKAWHRFRHQQSIHAIKKIALRVNYSLLQLPLSGILYIEGMDDYIRIHLQGQRPVITRMTMKTIEAQLPGNEFARIHKSYIVPISKIDFVRNKVVHINKYKIPMGVCYEQRFYQTIGSTCSIISSARQ